ncbi:MAG: zinc ABC transporter substrate-binding protein [Planctomycetaceae bacterium]|jgi:zinc transport system substrate-binding protein|nr:zinc ABC transporter substrate-binding protein [Planctomycetaceae bacterium]
MLRYILIIFLLLFCGCRDAVDIGDGCIILAVSVEPHAYLVERIGGGRVCVEVLVPMGKEPESYQPTPERIVMLTRAAVFFRTGMPFEEAIIPKLKSIASDLRVVDLRNGIKLRPMEFHNCHSHEQDHKQNHEHDHKKNREQDHGNSHGDCCEDHENSHKNNSGNHDVAGVEFDPHIWFSLELLRIEADTVLSVLIDLVPNCADEFRKNYENFISELESVKLKLSEILKNSKDKTIFAFHPTYGYFCDEFNLRQRSIEIGGKTPGPQQLIKIINETIKHGQLEGKKTVIFVQPEFNKTPANSIAEAVNGRIVEHSALEKNIFQSMINFAEEIAKQND